MLQHSRIRLRADPTGFFAGLFQVTDVRAGERATQLAMAPFGFRADFRLGGVAFQAVRGGWIPPVYLLESHGGVVCRATRPSLFHRSLEVRQGGDTYWLRSQLFSRTFDIWRAGESVGTIRPNGPFTRGVTFEARADCPRELAVFLIAVVLYRRRLRRRN